VKNMLRKAIYYSDALAIKKLIDWAAKKNKVLPRSLEEIQDVLDCFYVWVEHNEIVGCCSLEIYNKKLAEIRSLVVLPKYQNKGVGTNLVKTCVEEAKEKGIYEVLAITDKIKFFYKVGFRKCLDDQIPMFIKTNLNKKMK